MTEKQPTDGDLVPVTLTRWSMSRSNEVWTVNLTKKQLTALEALLEVAPVPETTDDFTVAYTAKDGPIKWDTTHDGGDAILRPPRPERARHLRR